MEFTITTGIKQLKTLINETADLTVVYRGIQRNYVWSNPSKKGYNDSLLKGRAVGTFVLADIQSCYDKARMDGNVSDMEFFDGFLKRNFEYISIDGNNRTSYCLHEWNSIDKENMSSEQEIFFRERQIPITIFRSCSREDMHLIAIRTNKGIAWNKQEDRNAIYGYVSDFIRDISVEMSTNQTSQLVLGLNPNRMQDDELFATMLAYHQHPTSNMSSSLLT